MVDGWMETGDGSSPRDIAIGDKGRICRLLFVVFAVSYLSDGALKLSM